MDYKKKTTIPFGAFDSELHYQEINIPDGFEATIKGDKVILKRKKSDDETILRAITLGIRELTNTYGWNYFGGITANDILAWIENKMKAPQNRWKPSDEQMRVLENLVEDSTQRYFYPTLKSLYDDLKKKN